MGPRTTSITCTGIQRLRTSDAVFADAGYSIANLDDRDPLTYVQVGSCATRAEPNDRAVTPENAGICARLHLGWP